jgi:tRNA nucleotidyltransferase (CCA-adding enzyme)
MGICKDYSSSERSRRRENNCGSKSGVRIIDKIRKDILKRIKPSKEEVERLEKITLKLLEVAAIVGKEYNYDPMPVGSTARGTWLKGDSDIDIFLLFPKSVTREELETKGLSAGKKIVKKLGGSYEIKYAEHPYVRAKISSEIIKTEQNKRKEIQFYNVDIVPCYRISPGEKIISAVDRSPLHNAYILRKLDPSLHDDIRLLKQFCKGIGIYGSDLKTQGVSGYLCELLVIRYGRFQDVIKSVSKFFPGIIIDIESHWFASESELKEVEHKIRRRFKNEPLIVIDPVDRNRNVASALNCENFVKFVYKSREFLSIMKRNTLEYLDFFFPKKKKLNKYEIIMLRKRGTYFILIIFNKPDVIDDILYPQLRKALQRIATSLRTREFKIVRKYEFVANNKCMLIFEIEQQKLPFVEKRIGPSIFASKNRKDFLNKYKSPLYGPYVEDEYFVIEKEREFLTTEDIIKKRYLDLTTKQLRDKGIPSEIAKVLPKGKIISGDDFFEFIEKNEELSKFIKEKYFDMRLRL